MNTFIEIIELYFLGVLLAFILLLIGNTICEKLNEEKAPLVFIFLSYIFVILVIYYCFTTILEIFNPIQKINKILNMKPSLRIKKNK